MAPKRTRELRKITLTASGNDEEVETVDRKRARINEQLQPQSVNRSLKILNTTHKRKAVTSPTGKKETLVPPISPSQTKEQEIVDEKSIIPNQFKICFWNLNGIRAVLKNGGTLQKFLTDEQPHILCLNETRISDEQCSNFSDCIPGYRGYFICSDKKGYAGVGTFIKNGVNAVVVSSGLGTKTLDQEGRIQTLEVSVPNIPTFYLVNTYVMNAGQKLVRLNLKIDEFNPLLYAHLNKLRETHPVIWCGDLNVAYEEIDIWNSKGNQKSAGHTPQERASFGKFLDSGRWIDVFRYHYPERVQYTYWSARFPSNYTDNKGWRLDYFVTTKEFIPYCQDVITYQHVRASDHCPILLVCSPPGKNSELSQSSGSNGKENENGVQRQQEPKMHNSLKNDGKQDGDL